MSATATAAGRRFENPVIQDVATLLESSEETGGERTLLEIEVAPGGGNMPHVHTTYAEHFEVLAGRLAVELDGAEHVLDVGDRATAPAGSVHRFRNAGPERAVFRVELRPGHAGFERSLRLGYALAADGRTNRDSLPRNPLHLAVLLEMSEMELAGRERVLQRPLLLLARLARVLGVDRRLERRYPG